MTEQCRFGMGACMTCIPVGIIIDLCNLLSGIAALSTCSMVHCALMLACVFPLRRPQAAGRAACSS